MTRDDAVMVLRDLARELGRAPKRAEWASRLFGCSVNPKGATAKLYFAIYGGRPGRGSMGYHEALKACYDMAGLRKREREAKPRKVLQPCPGPSKPVCGCGTELLAQTDGWGQALLWCAVCRVGTYIPRVAA